MIDAALDELNFNDEGLMPAIAINDLNDAVLMVAWINEEAFVQSLKTGFAHYFSRSRQRLWQKGESSGHNQTIKSIHLDCDGDVLTWRVVQSGGIACHTGRATCFYRQLIDGAWVDTAPVLKDPAEMYPE
ncbi:MAG: phosphoribosyl-AMP cyclohydrolase [Pseudomonadales bacterium]